jgi:hypothetical protein
MSCTYAFAPHQHRSHTPATRDPQAQRGMRRCARQRESRLSWIERFVLAIIVIALVAGVQLASIQPLRAVSSEQVRVQRGDSLWSIARSHPVVGLTTAQTAEQIRRLNGLRTSEVRLGQALSVPCIARQAEFASR